MRLHANAKLSVKGRELLVDLVEVRRASGLSATAARAATAWPIGPRRRRRSLIALRSAALRRSLRCDGCG